MDSPTIPFTSEDDKPLVPRTIDRSQVAPYRPSYTPEQAEKWRPLFDAMIQDHKNKVITCAATGWTSNTIYLKAQDALKWLAELHPTRKEAYATLRSAVAMSKRHDHVEVYFKPVLSRALVDGGLARATGIIKGVDSIGRDWKDEFERWLALAQPGEIWTKEGVHTSDEQRAFLLRTMAALGPDTQLEITDTMIRVMR